MEVGANSNFAQGWRSSLRDRTALALTDLRDGMRWDLVETSPGVYAFDRPETSYPDMLDNLGMGLSVTVNFGNPLYDGGDTPQSPEALAAQARYVAALVSRFPAIHTIEVGNEFNGGNFVRGPLQKAGGPERAAAHVAILKAIAEGLPGDRPVRVLGGAAHSIPAAYLWAILDGGGADYMDALVIHPYTTRAEEFSDQIGVLRRHPLARDMPIEVTEFGTPDPDDAPAFVFRWLAVMAVNGVERAVWFPLNPRGGEVPMIPLEGRDGNLTMAGRAYAFAGKMLGGQEASDVSPDPHTFAVRFGERTLVLWGEPRTVTLGAGVEAFDPEGNRLSAPLTLDAATPLILRAGETIALGDNVRLGEAALLADSYYDFAYPAADGTPPDGPFERVLRRDGQDLAFELMPGQERGDALWTPYLGRTGLDPARLTARSLLPLGGPVPGEIVHRYTAAADGAVDVTAEFEPSVRTEDGIAVTVRQNGETLFQKTGRTGIAFRDGLSLKAGDVLEFAVGPNGSHSGDSTLYRIRIGAPGALPPAPLLP